MRVLHYLDTLGRGGAEMQALDVARNASEFGLELTVVAGGGALDEEFRASGSELVRLHRRLPVDPFLVLQLRRIIKERKIDIVHGYQPVDGIHLYLATRGLRHVRTVLSFQGFIQDRKNRAAAKFLIPRMDANVVVSRGLQKWLSEKDGLDTSSKNFTVIYNGADPDRLMPSGHSIRAELGISSSTPLVGMVANFYRDHRKDQFSVVKAMGSVLQEIDNAHCIFAGGVEPGAEAKLLACKDFCEKSKINDRVHFLGSRSDIPDILAELDIAILSSFHEGLPVAITEAMLAGTPMIVSDIEPHLEASQNGQYAEIFPTGDSELLAKKILGLLDDNERRNQLAAKAREFALENLSIYSHLRELKKLYIRLLSD